MESTVVQALTQVAALRQVPRWSTVLEFLPRPALERPVLQPMAVNLAEYDQLVSAVQVCS